MRIFTIFAALSVVSAATPANKSALDELAIIKIHGFDKALPFTVCLSPKSHGYETVVLPDGKTIRVLPGERWSQDGGFSTCDCGTVEPEPVSAAAFPDHWKNEARPAQSYVFVWDLNIKDERSAHEWLVAQHARHYADIKISFNSQSAEMSFNEFRARIFGPAITLGTEITSPSSGAGVLYQPPASGFPTYVHSSGAWVAPSH